MPKTNPPCMRAGRAFSLVELLVVITIIGLLVAVLMPSLSKAREQAITITCESVERQNMIGLNSYATDNKGSIPPDNWLQSTSATYDSFYPWYPYPIDVTLGANTSRYAAAGNSPYGNRMGMGHVIGGGYLGSVNDIKSSFEPTYAYPFSAPYQGYELGTHAGMVSYYSNTWSQHGVSTTWTPAPSVSWSQNGYLYRGWLGDPSFLGTYGTWMLDRKRSPKIESMFDRAAIWCYLVNWSSQIKLPLCHNNGYNVGYFDGHSRFVPDRNAEITLTTYTPYWILNNFMVRDRFDPSIDQ